MSDDARPNWQVRKCFELENENKQLRESVNAWREEYIAASSKGEKNATALAEARKGLEFYGDKNNWGFDKPRIANRFLPNDLEESFNGSSISRLQGKTARTTLQRIEGILKEKESPKFKSRWGGASYVPDRDFRVGDWIFMDGSLCWRQITELNDKTYRWKTRYDSGESPIDRLDLFYIAKELRTNPPY